MSLEAIPAAWMRSVGALRWDGPLTLQRRSGQPRRKTGLSDLFTGVLFTPGLEELRFEGDVIAQLGWTTSGAASGVTADGSWDFVDRQLPIGRSVRIRTWGSSGAESTRFKYRWGGSGVLVTAEGPYLWNGWTEWQQLSAVGDAPSFWSFRRRVIPERPIVGYSAHGVTVLEDPRRIPDIAMLLTLGLFLREVATHPGE